MIKVLTNSLVKLFTTATFVVLVSLPGLLVAQCTDCAKQKTAEESSEAVKRATEACMRFNANIANNSLDNPVDSTTGHANHLDFLVVPLKPNEKTLISCTKEAYLKLLKSDPYPQMRALSAGLLNHSVYKGHEVHEALINALSDKCLVVRVYAATTLAIYHKRDSTTQTMDIRIERILRDVAVGNNRENWNLKGFYTKEEFDSNPDSTLEKCRDEVQRIAIAGLTSIISENEAMFLLDSIEKHGSTLEIRKNAKKGKKYWDR